MVQHGHQFHDFPEPRLGLTVSPVSEVLFQQPEEALEPLAESLVTFRCPSHVRVLRSRGRRRASSVISRMNDSASAHESQGPYSKPPRSLMTYQSPASVRWMWYGG